jgi:hypothetical protein
MSLEAVQTIIGRVVMEPEYRELLFDNPEKALEGYDLSEGEAAALRDIEREKFDQVAGELEGRISRAGGAFLLRDVGARGPLGRLFGDSMSVFTTGDIPG